MITATKFYSNSWQVDLFISQSSEILRNWRIEKYGYAKTSKTERNSDAGSANDNLRVVSMSWRAARRIKAATCTWHLRDSLDLQYHRELLSLSLSFSRELEVSRIYLVQRWFTDFAELPGDPIISGNLEWVRI